MTVQGNLSQASDVESTAGVQGKEGGILFAVEGLGRNGAEVLVRGLVVGAGEGGGGGAGVN